MKIIMIGVGLVAFAMPSLPADAQQASAGPDGHAVFEKWCAPCHAAGPFHAGTAGLQVKYKGSEPAVLEQREDLKASYVEYIIRHGVNTMPPFRKTEIADSEMHAIARYLSHGSSDLKQEK